MVELSPQIPNRIERRPIRTARHHETKSNALNMEQDTKIMRRCLGKPGHGGGIGSVSSQANEVAVLEGRDLTEVKR